MSNNPFGMGRSQMILRNRDLNVQQNNNANVQNNKEKQQLQQRGLNNKRQAPQIIQDVEEDTENREEPYPKRACAEEKQAQVQTHTSIIPKLNKALCIGQAKREDNAGWDQSSSTGLLEMVEQSPNQFFEEQYVDFDKENERDFTAVSHYAKDIFSYYKGREKFFRVNDYTSKQPAVTQAIRAGIVNWVIELQESFELNHETLYLGVKLFDMFVDRCPKIVQQNELQLIASTSIFIAAKFDERAPPLIDDFIYMAEDSFNRDQMISMERELLKIIEFDLGAPLSYRFLRRYARVSKTDMATLTLARYILETSLMSLGLCRVSESLIAASCLLLAKRMRKASDDWTITLQKTSGYRLANIEPLMWTLNRMLVQRRVHFGQSENAFRKYSHEIFFEVAATKPLEDPNHIHRRSFGIQLKPSLYLLRA